MTKEENNLLFVDLSGRFPYYVAINCKNNDSNYICYLTTDIINELKYNREYYEYKPYLFPISSMTMEQIEKYTDLCMEDTAGGIYYFTPDSIAWLNENHFDWRDLIPMGLANDATGLNIYQL